LLFIWFLIGQKGLREATRLRLIVGASKSMISVTSGKSSGKSTVRMRVNDH
jgi:hypothetical protein